MKICEEYAALLDMYVDGFCTGEETARVRKHLAECEACRLYVAQILQMKEAFPDAEEEEVPDGFAESVMAVIRAEAAPRKKRMKLWQRTLLQMAACMAIVIALGPLSERLTGGMEAKDAAVEMSMASTANKAQAPTAPAVWDAKADAAAGSLVTDQDLSTAAADNAEKAAEQAPEYVRTAAVKLTRSQMEELLSGYVGAERNGGVAYELTAAEFHAVLAKLPDAAVAPGGGETESGNAPCLLMVYPTD